MAVCEGVIEGRMKSSARWEDGVWSYRSGHYNHCDHLLGSVGAGRLSQGDCGKADELPPRLPTQGINSAMSKGSKPALLIEGQLEDSEGQREGPRVRQLWG
jgi:hypothetical protein